MDRYELYAMYDYLWKSKQTIHTDNVGIKTNVFKTRVSFTEMKGETVKN